MRKLDFVSPPAVSVVVGGSGRRGDEELFRLGTRTVTSKHPTQQRNATSSIHVSLSRYFCGR